MDSFVASGGMGTVYKIWDTQRSVPLAMKVLNADLAEDPSILKRFRREANALMRLTHPNIVPFYGMYETGDLIFLLEQYIDGFSLDQVIKQRRGKPLPLQETLTYLKALSAALGYAHALGVVHCDIKPGNIMISNLGSIFLTDFGVARHAESTTTTIGSAGTPAYMTPEQIRGDQVSPASDVYALGVMLFEMLTGQRPFKGTSDGNQLNNASSSERVRQAHLTMAPPDPCALNPSLPRPFANIILKALRKQPHERYQSVAELYADFLNAVTQTNGISYSDIPDQASIKPEEMSSYTSPDAPRMPTMPPAPGMQRTLITPSSSNLPGTPSPLSVSNTPISALPTQHAYPVTAQVVKSPKKSSNANIVVGLVAGAAILILVLFMLLESNQNLRVTPISVGPSATSTPISKFKSLSGSGTVQMVDGPLVYITSFSPDQTRLVASVSELDATDQITLYEVDLNGGGLVRQVTTDSNVYFHPQFAPDGRSILVESGSSDANANSHIYLINFETGETILQLTDMSGNDTWPSWMPDYRSFVFMTDQDGNSELYRGFVDGSPPERLTDNATEDSFPCVSPDGRWLAYISGQSGAGEVFSMDLQSREITQLTSNGYDNVFPIISPDGRWIVFTSDDQNQNFSIWAIESNGANLHQISTSTGIELATGFSLDGKWLLQLTSSSGSGTLQLIRTEWNE